MKIWERVWWLHSLHLRGGGGTFLKLLFCLAMEHSRLFVASNLTIIMLFLVFFLIGTYFILCDTFVFRIFIACISLCNALVGGDVWKVKGVAFFNFIFCFVLLTEQCKHSILSLFLLHIAWFQKLEGSVEKQFSKCTVQIAKTYFYLGISTLNKRMCDLEMWNFQCKFWPNWAQSKKITSCQHKWSIETIFASIGTFWNFTQYTRVPNFES